MSALDEARRLDDIEARAYSALFDAAPPPFAAAVGMRHEQIGGATLLLAPGLPLSLFNRAIGLGVSRPATEQDVDQIVARYRATGVGEAWIHQSPGAEPAATAGWLEARGLGLAARPRWAKVAFGAALPPASATALEVREIGPADGARFAEIITRAHGMPAAIRPWTAALVGAPRLRSYLVFDGETAIGGGLLFLDGADAWLGLAGTLPEHRRRGAQGAVMIRRIRDAQAAGATVITTETGEPVAGEANPSLANMYRHGFTRRYARSNYALLSPAR